MLYSFDASTMIHFFDNYPMDNPHLEKLWSWFSEKMVEGTFVISKRAFDEVMHKTSPEFHAWFKEVKIIEDEAADLFEAQKINELLEIEEEDFGSGVGENDIFIISISKRIGACLVSEEKVQTSLPRDKKKYKIPAVCNLIGVECICFTDLLRINP